MERTDEVNVEKSTNQSFAHKRLDDNLNEQEILLLQDVFLTNGLHTVYAPTIATGRKRIDAFLQSLPMYTYTACVTTQEYTTLPAQSIDVYALLQRTQCSEQDIEEFFINQAYFDCMWIEMSPDLLEKPWFEHFCKFLKLYSQKMPVIKVYYEKTGIV